MKRYEDEISVTKHGYEQEVTMFRFINRDPVSNRIITSIRGKDP